FTGKRSDNHAFVLTKGNHADDTKKKDQTPEQKQPQDKKTEPSEKQPQDKKDEPTQKQPQEKKADGSDKKQPQDKKPPEKKLATKDQPLPKDFTNSIGMKFALIPRGKSWLGGGGGKVGTKETKILRDFYLGVYEVSQEEWFTIMGINPSSFKAVQGISVEDQK